MVILNNFLCSKAKIDKRFTRMNLNDFELVSLTFIFIIIVFDDGNSNEFLYWGEDEAELFKESHYYLIYG